MREGVVLVKKLIKRFIQSIGVLIAVSIIVFLIMNLMGDPIYNLLPEDASQEEIDNLRFELILSRALFNTSSFISTK